MYKRLKKDTKWSIIDLGKFKIDSIKSEVLQFSEEWNWFTTRQKTFYTHRDTQMFPICLSDETNWDPRNDVEVTQMNRFKKEESNFEIDSIFSKLKEYYSGEIIRCEVVKLPARTSIRTHVDGGPLLHYSRRVHIPIITNENVTFTVMSNTINMQEGTWYEINNQMTHAANNNSDLDRVHMIIDILPNDMLQYTKIGD
jgi:hypothetical protein